MPPRRRFSRRKKTASSGPAGMTLPSRAPTQRAIQTTYDRRLDQFVRDNQDSKNQMSSEASVVADMPDKFKQQFKNTDGSTKTYDQMNEKEKSIFNFYDDGRNQYQRDLNRLISNDPAMQQAYARRFPLENTLMRGLPTVVGAITGVPLNVARFVKDKAFNTLPSLKQIAINKGILSDVRTNDVGTTAVDNTDTTTPMMMDRLRESRIDQQGMGPGITGLPGSNRPGTFVDPIMRVAPTINRQIEDPGILPTDVQATRQLLQGSNRPQTYVDPIMRVPNPVGLQSLFTGETPTNRDFSGTQQQPFNPPMILGGNPRGEVQSARLGALLGSDPNIAYGQEMNMLDVLAERARRGFNEGGLASINNPQYNMLMNASNFTV